MKTNFMPFLWKIKIVLAIISFSLLIFMLSRLILANFLSESFFSDLSSIDILLACINGIRFDLSTLSYLIFPLLFLMFLPINSKKYIKTLTIVSIILSVFLILYYIGDIIFFSMFNKHITSEILASTGSLSFLIKFAITEYFIVILSLIILLSLLILISVKYINNVYIKHEFIRKNNIIISLFLLIFIFLSIISMRGSIKFNNRPIRLSDAYNLGNEKIALLTLVGIYPAYEHILKFSKIKLLVTPPPLYITFIHENITTPSLSSLNKDYPYYRKYLSSIDKLKNKNIVIIFFESWDRILIDDYNHVAPNFINLKENGIYLPNFYTTGLRSITGITSTFLSIPHNPLLPYLHNGLLNKDFSKIARYFNNMDYNTLFIQTDEARQEHMDKISKYLEFKEFYSKENIPILNKYPNFEKGFDKDGFEFLYNQINSQKDKFFAVFYTSSTHMPYDTVLDEKTKIFDGNNQVEQYLNRVSYVDSAIGDFFSKASKEEWFNDTIFLLFSDHNAIFSDINNRKNDELYKNFLIIYAPSLIEPNIINNIATQEDILPTLLHISGSNDYFSSSGSSIFDKERRNKKVIYSEDSTAHLIDGNKISAHNLFDIYKKQFNDLTDEEKYVITNLESIYYHIINDKWISRK